MPWQTVDARPQKRRTGDAVEDAERRELRLRRTYNEAAAGHALAAKAASAPPADAVAALYEKILEDVGSAAKENEAPWDAALRLACARHLSELLEAAGDRAGALAAACRAADAGRNDAGLWLRVARLARVAEGVAAARVAVGALQRAAALRRAEREDDGALERPRAVGVKRACFRGVAADAGAAPPAPRTVRSSQTWAGLGNALLAARAALARDARAGRATLDHPVAVEWIAEKKKAEAAQAKKPAEAPGDEKADEGKDDEKRPRRGARRRGAAPTEEKEEDDAVAELPLAARVFGALLDGAPPPKPPDGVAAAWFARAAGAGRRRRGRRRAAVLRRAAPRPRPPRGVRRRGGARRGRVGRGRRGKVFAEAVAAVDGALDPAALVALAEVDSSALARARLDPRTADPRTSRRGSTGWPPRARRRGATLLLRGPSSKPARGRSLSTAASTPCGNQPVVGAPPGSVER